MNKEDFIARRGEEAYEKRLQQSREWYEKHPEKIKVASQEQSRKGGKYYEQLLKHISTGIQHAKRLVRVKHAKYYRPYKKIIAPDSELHHQWVASTANYDGVALVEKEQHRYGIIDVIQILEGEITLLTEAEIIRKGGEKK